MNYLVASDGCFLDLPSGSARVAWDIALAMRDHGCNVAMACFAAPQWNGPAVQEVEGIRILRCTFPAVSTWNPRRTDIAIRAYGQALTRHLGQERWDTAHLHNLQAAAGAMRALGQGPRYVYTVHSPVVLELRINWLAQGLMGRLKLLFLGKVKRIERELLEGSDGIHALSEFIRDHIEAFHPGMGERVTVIPHWRRPDLRRTLTKTQARQKLNWPTDAKVIFTLRRHVARMGLDVAIEALAPLAAAGRCTFILGGDGPLRPVLEQQATSLGASPHQVRFLGRLSEQDLHLAYQAADVFLLPTTALEGFGLITVEALSFGCPVIGTDAGATPEILNPISPDLVVQAGDVRALRAKVESVLDGRLVLPDEKTILDYVNSRYDPGVVLPKLWKLLEGDRQAR